MIKTKIDRYSVIEREPNHVDALIGVGETVVMSVEEGAHYGLNDVASRIWELLSNSPSTEAICQGLCKEYDADPATCEEEVLACLDTLCSERRIRVQRDTYDTLCPHGRARIDGCCCKPSPGSLSPVFCCASFRSGAWLRRSMRAAAGKQPQ